MSGKQGKGGRHTPSEREPVASQLRLSIHPTYARLVSAELRRRGFSDEEILEGMRLTREQLVEDNRFLSLEQFRRLARRAIALTGEGWLGLDVGRSTQISAHGPLGYAMMASRDVGQVLDMVQRYSSLRVEIAKFDLVEHGDRVHLVVEETLPWGNISEYLASHIFGTICLVLETVSGAPLPDTRVAFTHASPPWAAEYEKRLPGIDVSFGAPACVLDFPSSFLATRCITADPATFEQAVRMCERAESRRDDDCDLAQRVLDRLLDRDGDYPSLTEMAAELAMSNRTFIRKLKAQDTSYQMLLDDVRQELAIWYLRQSDLSAEAIAERLGYRDTSNFSRTCKRWFGLTPRQIRQG
jgi:AraC-like DNA-binding protein